jgi:hypothetical protein
MRRYFALLALVAFACGACGPTPGNDPKSKAQAAPVVTATELLEAYDKDAEKADGKFKGQWLRVKGKVNAIHKISTPAPGSARVEVVLEADEKDIPGEVLFLRPRRVMGQPVPGTEAEDFEKLTKGQEVTLGGLCQGKEKSRVTFTRPVLMDD